MLELKLTNFSNAWGSDNDFNKLKIDLRAYRAVVSSTTVAMRVRAEMSGGDTPFFALSRLDMNGFSTSRYTDRHTLSLQAEVRYKFHPRWGLVGFAEAGQYASKLEDIFE